MKFNWGTGIVLAIVGFISFIMFMVVTMMSTRTDVVETDYYQQQIAYEGMKEAKENGLSLKGVIGFAQTAELLQITFPLESGIEGSNNGIVHFYRPENAALDKKFEIDATKGNIIEIPKSQLTKGSYKVKMSWSNHGKDFFVEKSVFIE